MTWSTAWGTPSFWNFRAHPGLEPMTSLCPLVARPDTRPRLRAHTPGSVLTFRAPWTHSRLRAHTLSSVLTLQAPYTHSELHGHTPGSRAESSLYPVPSLTSLLVTVSSTGLLQARLKHNKNSKLSLRDWTSLFLHRPFIKLEG